MNDSSRQFDLAIIGAGINGAGIARDAAMRGLSVIVLEQGDICSSTSAASSRLIHGGLRYLEYGEIPLVYESLHERRYLRRIAGHLVKPLRISIPIYEGAKRGPFLIRLGMLAYDLLSWGKAMPRHDMLGRIEMLAKEPGLRGDSLEAAARYYDAQVTFAERLVLENLLAAKAAGATVNTYCRVTGMRIAAGKVEALHIVDEAGGEAGEVRAHMVVNAAGPWVDQVLSGTELGFPRFIGGTKGSHIVISRFPGAPQDAFYVEAAADGRPVFIIPWNGLLLIGTTDLRYKGDLANVRASRAEVDYLLTETNRVFPGAGLGIDDVHYGYAGVRPLPFRDKGPESAITRKHIIKSHRAVVRGLFSIIGGKLTTYRSLAEQATNKVGKALGRRLPECRTHDTLLPGAFGIDAARDALREMSGLSADGQERLINIYGGRAAGIAALATKRPELASFVDAAATVPAAEIAFVIAEELPQTLIDICYRRTMIGFGADQGRPMYGAIGDIAAQEFGWSAARAAEEVRALERYSDSLRVSEGGQGTDAETGI